MTAHVDGYRGGHRGPAALVEQPAQRERVQRDLDGEGHEQRGEVAGLRAHRAAAEVGALTVVAALLAARAPLLVSVAGLIAFGILHNALELRYVAARCRGLLTGRFLAVTLGLVTVIAFARLLGPVTAARRVEVVAGFAVLAAGLVRGARRSGRTELLVAGLPAVAVAGWAAYRNLDLYFVSVTYLHNLVPFVFLWDWSARRLAGRARTAFRAAQAGWLVVVPALLLTGALPVPSLAAQATDAPFAGAVGAHVAQAAPPAWRDGVAAPRLLALFAFLQVLHYAFWCWFFPRRGGLPALPARSPRVRSTASGVALGAVALAAVLVLAWPTGKTLYVSVASYHAYLEYAVLAAVVAALPDRTERIPR